MLVAQLFPTLAAPWSVHGILKTRILEWVAIPFSGGVFSTQGIEPRSSAL